MEHVETETPASSNTSTPSNASTSSSLPSSPSPRIEQLRHAIDNLRRFADRAENDDILPYLHNLDVKDGTIVTVDAPRVRKYIEVARCFVTALLLDEEVRASFERRHERVEGEILKAIDFVQTNASIIENLQRGSESEVRLAEEAMQAIQRFNSAIKRTEKHKPSIKSRLARLVFDKSHRAIGDSLRGRTIILPHFLFDRITPSDFSNPPFGRKVKIGSQTEDSTFQRALDTTRSLTPSAPEIKPTRHERDAIGAKWLSMLDSRGVCSTIIQETLSAMKVTPIETYSVKTPLPEEVGAPKSPGTVVKFVQELCTFPGEWLVLEGAFHRNPEAQVPSRPIPNTFRLSTRSTQSGFPHPLQNGGWSLSAKMIPSYPHLFEELPIFRQLYRRKQEISQALLRDEKQLAKAKEIVKIKKRLFEAELERFTFLHSELAKRLLIASSTYPVQRRAIEVIEDFFAGVYNHKDSYSYLSHTYQSLNELFIDRPYGALKREWLSDQFLDSDNENAEQRYRAAVRVFYREIRECEREMLAWIKNGSIGYHTPESLDFIALMGPCLAKPACSIILQFLSESLRFSPPVLSPFDQTIQKLLYAQLITFLEENSLEIPDSEEEQKRLFHMRMEEALLRDIGWIREKGLQTHDTLSLPIRELENYYYGRSLSR